MNRPSPVPCREDGPVLTVAVTDPSRYTSREAEHDFPGEAVRFVVAPRNDILAAMIKVRDAHGWFEAATPTQKTVAEVFTKAVKKVAAQPAPKPAPKAAAGPSRNNS